MDQEIDICFPLYFAAPLAWYAAAIGHNKICIADNHIFPGHPWMNRIAFTGKQGRQSFSIPLVSLSRHGRYRDVEISYRSNWHRQLVNALRTCYGKSPFFEYFDYRLEPIILREYQFLWDLNYAMLEETLQCLKVSAALKTLVTDSENMECLEREFEPGYYQVFAEHTGFIPNLSILDLLFNEGMDASNILLGARIQ